MKHKRTPNLNYRFLLNQSKPAQRWLFLSIALGIIAGILIIIQAGILATVIDHVYINVINNGC